MRTVACVVFLSVLAPLAGCRSAAPNGEKLDRPLGLEEVSIVSKGLE